MFVLVVVAVEVLFASIYGTNTTAVAAGGAGAYRTGTGLTVPAATHQIEVGYSGDRGIAGIGGQTTANYVMETSGGTSSIDH